MSWGIILLALFLNIYHENAQSINDPFDKCCKLGNDWAKENLRCEKFTGPVEGIADSKQGLCLKAIDICCIRAYHEKYCETGKKNARDGLNCVEGSGEYNHKNKTNHDEYQRDCCQGCKLGILTGSMTQQCSLDTFSFGKPWDSAFLECCSEVLPSSTTQSTEIFSTSSTDYDNLTSINNITLPSSTSSDFSSSFPDDVSPTSDDLCKIFKGLMCPDNDMQTLASDSSEFSNSKSLTENSVTYRTDTPINRCESDNPCEHRCVDTGTEVKCECDPGFVVAKDGHSCQQKPDPTKQLTTTMRTTKMVSTTEGNSNNKRVPRCPPGYKYNTTARICDDINECSEQIDVCGDEVCYNQPGGYSCARVPAPITESTTIKTELQPTIVPQGCSPGYKYVRNQGCRDIDECIETEDACSSNEECLNKAGGYTCNCRTGFRRDNLTQACVDINECQLQNDCLPTQRCDNTLGSYNCVRFLPCGTGYTLNAATEICEDDDECFLGTHDCGNGYHCRNTLGSYRCDRNQRGQAYSTRPPIFIAPTTPMRTIPVSRTITTTIFPIIESRIKPTTEPCPDGFVSGSSGQCIDIDECQQSATNPCVHAMLQRCINTIGSYQCTPQIICGPGWKLDTTSSRCIDIDECMDRTHQCARGQKCENRLGGYFCSCPPGHVPTSSNRECVDVDECSLYGGICMNGQCENTVGSFRCICDPGFRLLESGTDCQDINECEQTGLCQHLCVNANGSYRCRCNAGYRLNSDNRTCEDIDECEEFKDSHICVGSCNNTPGSYECRCPNGYRLGTDGRTCQDIDECQTERVCRDPNDICLNTRGGFKCNRINCPEGYHQDSNRKNRCVRSGYCSPTDPCMRMPSYYSYYFITFVSLIPIPKNRNLELFTMKGTHLPDSIVRFSMALVDVTASPEISRATESDFALRRPSPSQAVLVLTHSIPGPQKIELDLAMEIYHNNILAGSALAKLIIYVSQYEF